MPEDRVRALRRLHGAKQPVHVLGEAGLAESVNQTEALRRHTQLGVRPVLRFRLGRIVEGNG
jgi:hypothetical protein